MLRKKERINPKKIEKNIFLLLTYFAVFANILLHCIPRLCNGSTSDSGSDCGGSNPPWGTKVACRGNLFLLRLNFWSLRLSARTGPSQGRKAGSTPVGTASLFFCKNRKIVFKIIINYPYRLCTGILCKTAYMLRIIIKIRAFFI